MTTHKNTTNTLNTGNHAVTHSPPRAARRTQLSRLGRQRGFTAIELGVVLLVIGVLSVAVFQVMAGMVADANTRSMGDQLVASSLRLQQRYISEPAGTRYDGIGLAAARKGDISTLTEALRKAIVSGVIKLSDTGTAALASPGATGATSGKTNLMWTLATLERDECKILIRKLAPAARVILGNSGGGGSSSAGIIRSRPGNELLTKSDIDATCVNDAATNTFMAVF